MANEVQKNNQKLGDLSQETMSLLVLNGDLSKLSPSQKVEYVAKLCERIGVDPLTQPFKIIKMSGKEVVYADKGCTQQLCKIYNISTEVKSKEKIDDIYVVTVRASVPEGQFTDDDGAVSIGAIKGEALSNAMMKAVTKAKRRSVLSLCGLGMLDETEVESVLSLEKERNQNVKQNPGKPKFSPPPAKETKPEQPPEDVEFIPEEPATKTQEIPDVTQEDITKLIATAISNKYSPTDIAQKFSSLGYQLTATLNRNFKLEHINPKINMWDYEDILVECEKPKGKTNATKK